MEQDGGQSSNAALDLEIAFTVLGFSDRVVSIASVF